MTDNSASQRLYSEWRRLKSQFSDIKSSWDDEVSNTFSNRFVSPIESPFKELLDSLQNLEESIGQVERDPW